MISNIQRLLIATISGAALLLPTGLSASAQTATNTAPLSQDTLRDLRQEDRSLFSNGGGSSNFNMMQLIHNANLLNGRSPEQVSSEQSEAINDAVKNFRTQQSQQLKLDKTPESTAPKPAQ